MNTVLQRDVRAAVVDDHGIILDGITSWVDQHRPAVQILTATSRPSQALAIADQLDVVVLDVDLGDEPVPTWEWVQRFSARGVHVLIVSAAVDPDKTRAAVIAGACGFVSKRNGWRAVIDAVLAIADGQLYSTGDLAAALASGEDRPDLSEMQLTVLQLFAAGLPIESVAQDLGVAKSTIKEHLRRIRSKYRDIGRTDVATRTSLTLRAREDGLVK